LEETTWEPNNTMRVIQTSAKLSTLSVILSL